MGKDKEEDKSGRHENKSIHNGYEERGYDHAATKDVSESSDGKHSEDDK